MLALLLGILLAPVPADSSDDLDACLRQAPVQSPPPITWGGNIPRMWSSTPPVSLDSVRASLSQVRAARACFLALDAQTVERPYLGNILRTFQTEAALLAALRRFSAASETFEAAWSYLESDPPVPATEEARRGWPRALHQNQGFLYYHLGDLSSAINHYLKALQDTPEDAPSLRVRHLIDVAVLHQHTQDYRSARQYFDRAAHLFRESTLTSETHPQRWSRLLSTQADFLLEKTLNTDLKRTPLKRARDLAEQVWAAAEPGTKQHAGAALTLSESLGYLGAFDRAYRLNGEARRYARVNDDPRFYTFSLLKLGVLHLQTEQWAQADSILHEALSQAEAFGDLDYQRRILRDLGRLHEMQARWDEAERFYRRGVAVIENYRESLTATQWSSTAFAQWRDVHRGLVRALLAQDQPREALAALDRTRARHLQDLRTRARVVNQLPPTARARLDSLSRALADVRTRLGTEVLSDDEEARLHTREASLMTTRRQLLKIGSTVDTRPSIDEVAETLAGQNRALVSYFLDDPWAIYDRAPHSAAFVLTADTLYTVSLPGLTQDSVRAQVTDIAPLFAQQDEAQGVNAMHFDLRPLRRLHDQLYAPIAEHLSAGQPLTVVPDGPMFHVPYSMLATAAPGGRFDPARTRFVLHERPTTLELATSMVSDTSSSSFDPTTAAPDLAALGVSEFDTLRSVPPALQSALPAAARDSILALPPLPGVRAEIDALNRRFRDVQTFLDEAATESAFASATQQAGVVHLASHAFVHPSAPLQNAVLLHPDSSSDGFLFLHELQARDRPLPLAVLSGCRTAQGALRRGEGMAGLQYAFRAMGTQSTVANLWPTADQSSAALMNAFYQNLQEGLPKDRALRQAKLTYLDNHPDRASPFFWAPSVLYGSPQPVPLEGTARSLSWSWWLSGFIVILVLLGGIALRRYTRFSLPSRRVFSG